MEQAVALCPKTTMTIKGHRTHSLLDLGSEVTLVIESYFKEHIEPLIPPAERDTLNAHNLFTLRGVEDGCVPLSKYFMVDVMVGGRLVHNVGFLVKRDGTQLTDSKGRKTQAPAILGCNLVRHGLEEFIHDFGEDQLLLFECP